jgi:hypothetical protein
VERHYDGLAASASIFHHRVGYALCQLAFLVGGATSQHCHLNQWHGAPVFSRLSSVVS